MASGGALLWAGQRISRQPKFLGGFRLNEHTKNWLNPRFSVLRNLH